MSLKRKIYYGIGSILIAGLISIQFVPVDRSNPPVKKDIGEEYEIPERLNYLLRSHCYDCHSNETKWPWYGYLAPVSWYILDDVRNGRAALNLSEWDVDQETSFWEATDKIESHEMPLRFYFPQPTLKQRKELTEGIDKCSY
jgi:hypothetical protein